MTSSSRDLRLDLPSRTIADLELRKVVCVPLVEALGAFGSEADGRHLLPTPKPSVCSTWTAARRSGSIFRATESFCKR